MPEPLRFTESVTVRVPPDIAALIDRAARARGSKPSEWARQALQTALRLDGFDLATEAPRDAGSLYNVVAGRRSYALIEGDRIASLSYHDLKPEDGRTWLPVEYEDSEPFDAALHWRLAPIDRIDGDKVVRVYPVVMRESV